MRRPTSTHWLIAALLFVVAACAPVRPVGDSAPSPSPSLAAEVSRGEVQADFVRVRKAQRTLEVWSQGRLLRTIGGVQLGFAPVGPKRFEGDGRTPEGRYLLDWRNPNSAFHLSLHVSYPTAAQEQYARQKGHTAGGLIMIHGQPNGHPGRMQGDWTDGCIALSDAEIESLWDIVPDGTMVEILP